MTLARGVRLLTYDRPGYGDSTPHPGRTVADEAGHIAAIARHVGAAAVHLVGWSSGGAFALAAAAKLPDLVRSVAISAGDAPFEETPELLAALPDAVRDLVRDARAGDPTVRERIAERIAWYATDPTRFIDGADADQADAEAQARDAGTAAPAPDPDLALRRRHPEVGVALRAMFSEGARQGTAGFVDDWVAEVQAWAADVEALRAPIDLWWGDADPLTPRAQVEALARLLPAATVRIVPGAGHGLPMAAWPGLLDALLAPPRPEVSSRAPSGGAGAGAARRSRSRARGAGGR